MIIRGITGLARSSVCLSVPNSKPEEPREIKIGVNVLQSKGQGKGCTGLDGRSHNFGSGPTNCAGM